MYRYETHLHTSPVSACARKTVRENLEFYRDIGYAGVFITNHFLDGNFAARNDESMSYEDKIRFYCGDFEEGEKLAKEIGIDVFFGVELSYKGTDFLVYGLGKDWFLAHPEIMEMKKSDELRFMTSEGAFIVQAHPFREKSYIDHVRLFPRCVHGVEVINASLGEFENRMADYYAGAYGLCRTAGSDNHSAGNAKRLAGVEFETPLRDVADYTARVRAGEGRLFTVDRTEEAVSMRRD
ncbi:MAG: histidinol phosphatase [Clostridia bacterium]|nr:histidinol phosphatase [Clostridia bacterium]